MAIKPRTRPVPPPPPELQLPAAERIEISPHLLLPSEFLFRDTIPEEGLDRLTESVRNSGFAGSATGMRRADGTIVLTGGKRLWLVAKRLGCMLPVDVRPEGPLVAVVEAVLAHSHQERLNVFEVGRLYRNALQEMTRVLGYDVTQAMLSAWLGINPSIVSQCLCIVRHLTPKFVAQHGLEFTIVKNRSRTALYAIAKIRDKKARAAHLIKLVTGKFPAWYTIPQQANGTPPFTRRSYGLRSTYSIQDTSEITDAQLDELFALVRSDVEISRRATEADVAA